MAEEIVQNPEQPEQGKAGFFSTPAGKAVMIVGALGVLAVIAGVAVAVVLRFVLPQVADVEIRVPEQQASKPATQAAGGKEGPAQPAPAVSYDQVFRFRDIFDPLIKPSEETSEEPAPTETTTDTVDATEYAPNTLYFINIAQDSERLYAVLVWNGTVYTLPEGGVIPDSPWKVLDIRTSSVIMLYGDQQVVIALGQGVQK